MAHPRFKTQLEPGLDSWADEIAASAEGMGTPLMTWQAEGAALIGALSVSLCSCHKPGLPLPRYKTVLISVPRQQGKTILSRATLDATAKRWPDEFLYGTAQTRDYAAKHVLNLGKALAGQGVQVKRGKGAEAVIWPNETAYGPLAPNESGGHGDSITLMLVDEAWTLTALLMGGIRPAMIAKPHSQLVLISTMGTVESDYWNALVAKARESLEDPNAKVAYLEYSANEDSAVWEESRWHEWMPALGITVQAEDIRSAIEDMVVSPEGAAGVVRAFGNRVTQTLSVVFPDADVKEAWRVLQPAQRYVVAVDVNESPPGATVVQAAMASDPREEATAPTGVAVNQAEWRYGAPTWVAQYVDGLLSTGRVDAVVGDFGGPAKQVHAELKVSCETRGVPLIARTPSQLAADTLTFFNALRDRAVYLTQTPELESAITGAKRKNLGDMWLVSRNQMTVDASPVIGAVLAHGVAKELSVQPVVDWWVL